MLTLVIFIPFVIMGKVCSSPKKEKKSKLMKQKQFVGRKVLLLIDQLQLPKLTFETSHLLSLIFLSRANDKGGIIHKSLQKAFHHTPHKIQATLTSFQGSSSTFLPPCRISKSISSWRSYTVSPLWFSLSVQHSIQTKGGEEVCESPFQ